MAQGNETYAFTVMKKTFGFYAVSLFYLKLMIV